jgi:hypothetical protein
MKKGIVILIMCLLESVLYAQKVEAGLTLRGFVSDSAASQPLEFATVSIYQHSDGKLQAGALTDEKGSFTLSNIPPGKYKLKVVFIGYKNYEKAIELTPQDINYNLGVIKIVSASQNLKEVEIVAERPTMVMTIDKKVYSVDKDLSVKGGTGLDAVKNVPGVSIDNDGNVTLRNNDAQIFIDGKQTNLTLQQIPADQIERIEVITNPSAKFDANTTGGILNIILKKNNQPNFNGSVILGIGTSDRYSATTTLNQRTQKFNFSGMYSYNTENNNINGFTNRENLASPVPVKFYEQKNQTSFLRTSHTAKIGADYYLNKQNTISLSQAFNTGIRDIDETQTFKSLNANEVLYSYGDRINVSGGNNKNYISQIGYKKTFSKPGKELSADAQYTYSESVGDYLYTTNDTVVGNAIFTPIIQKNNNGGNNNLFTFQSDFINPINDSAKIEFGVKTVFKQNKNANTTENYLNAANAYIYDSALSNNYLITDLVNAAYVNYMRRLKKINIQAGLRFEQSYYNGTMLDRNNQTFGYSYPSSGSTIFNTLFPSLYLSRKISDKNEIQFNVTRKINRPNFFQLLPIVFFADNYNYRTGNPSLKPEFLNKAEINYSYTKQQVNFLTALYGQYSENAIIIAGSPSAINPSILINTYQNSKGSFSYGWENVIRVNFLKFITSTLTFNPYYLVINYTDSNGSALSAKGYSFNSKLVINIRLPKDFSIQANGAYEAPKPLPQGNMTHLYFFDLSVSKSLNKRFIFNLILSDVLNSKQRGINFYTSNYNQELMRRREARYLKFTATWLFGNANITPKKKSGKDQRSGGDMPEMGDF